MVWNPGSGGWAESPKARLALAVTLLALAVAVSACGAVEELATGPAGVGPPAGVTPDRPRDLALATATSVFTGGPTIGGPSEAATETAAQPTPTDRSIGMATPTATPTISLLVGPAADLAAIDGPTPRRPLLRLRLTPRAGEAIGHIPTRAPLGRPAPTWTPAPQWYPDDQAIGPLRTPPATPTPETWRQVARWQGNSSRSTETFHVPSHEWRISWDTWPDEYGETTFAVFLYDAGGGYLGMAANVTGANSDSRTMQGAGDYYLAISTGQRYVIVVEAKE
ncbi:MAG TPA: hypothetical protein VMX14_11455 [Anaerolineae bacterium]|nr:hypothetical protein [Anaerolineae bacterium]